MNLTILRRTFAASKTSDPAERASLNLDALTSQYYTSHRYLVRVPFPNHPTQKYTSHTFRTRAEAQAFIDRQ